MKNTDIEVMTNNDFAPNNNANNDPQDQQLNLEKNSQQSPPVQNPLYSSPYAGQQPQPNPYYATPAPPQQPQYQAPQPNPYQQAPQPPYGYNQAQPQNYYQPPVARRKNNSFAITAFILGLSQIVFWWLWIPAPLAVIFGHIALSQIKKTGEEGRTFALVGLILGYVGIFIGFLFLFFIFWASAFDGYNGYNDYNDYSYNSSELM